MSSILKALKKLEEEQAGRASSAAGGGGGQFVAPSRGGRPLLLLVFGIATGLLLAGGLYVLLGQRAVSTAAPTASNPTNPTVAAPIVATPAAIPAVSAAPVRPAVPPAVTRPAAKAAKADKSLIPATASEPAAVTPQAPAVAVLSVQRPAAEEAAGRPSGEGVGQVQIERREIPAAGQQWAAPQLAVSEVLPSSGGERMAIVNGLPVMEGTTVENAVVREIHPDRVLFVIDGKSVVVPVSATR
ncbi:MAG: hypothetical protein FDZ69_00660 [Deltaproteobacteria bacterium]|nr:MAG: hypothetical protein FDZ69_00660 [Deltaproteobacteria bacterium]